MNKAVRFAKQSLYLMIALAFTTVSPFLALAQTEHTHTQQQQPALSTKANDLVKIVRENTARFKDVSVAQAEGYQLQFGCVSGDSSGAMGMHFVNGDLVGKGVIDATKPQIVIYEPLPNGQLHLIGADYLVLADTWNRHHTAPPELMGQLFHLFEAPNRFGLPSFYTLHVWAWKDNPNGAFVNWHPSVDCEQFNAPVE